jgi:uncharacterized Fe-S center protein
MEAEDFVNREVQMDNPDDVITAKQRKYLFAVGSSVKLSTTDVKNIIESFGYSSTTQIKKSDFDSIVEAVRAKENINA